MGQILITGAAISSGYPVAWFAPTYKMLADVWRQLRDFVQPVTVNANVTERRIQLVNGGVIDMWSLDGPDAARGRKYARIVIDEAARVPALSDVWYASIRPTLTDLRGDAWFMSTPKGRNDFFALYMLGQTDSEWASWQMPTATNPFIPSDEIENARRMLPDRIFQQEYLADFLEDSAVFRYVTKAVKAPGQSHPIEGHTYVIGCDWGKLEDFSVFVVMDATHNEVAYIDRMNQVDYVTQADRLVSLSDKWKPQQIITETTGVGEPIADMLRDRGLALRRFKTTRKSKEELIGWLIKAFDELAIGITNDSTLIAELQVMEAIPSASGMRYEAPAGFHDDIVVALALAWDGVRKSGVGQRTISRRIIV